MINNPHTDLTTSHDLLRFITYNYNLHFMTRTISSDLFIVSKRIPLYFTHNYANKADFTKIHKNGKFTCVSIFVFRI